MRCTCCGNSQWTLMDMATLPIAVDLHTTRFFYSQGIPQISIMCANCGHTLYFNPVVMGIKPDEPTPQSIDGDSPS
jgi:ribosomal protein S27E